MRLFILCLIFIFGSLHAQNTCSSALSISADSLSRLKIADEVVYFKIQRDSTISGVFFKEGFKSIIVQPLECLTNQHSFKLDSTGLILPTEDMINSGICYCSTCIERVSKFSLNDDLYIKVLGGSDLKLELIKDELNEQQLEWYQKRLKSGDKIMLDKILFVGGLAKFRSVSFKDLKRLFSLLEQNRDVDVEIHGHVNRPGKRNSKKDQALSNQRAQAVVDYLVKKGINRDRLSALGFGNTRMVYPNAKTEFEMQFNRRVEILVK